MTDQPPFDLDDEIKRRTDLSLNQHESSFRHLDEAAIRAIVQDELSQIVFPPTQPPVGLRIPDEDLILNVDPARRETWDLQVGQRWAAGNMIQGGAKRDYVIGMIPEEHRQGYGLEVDADGNIHSWPMANGRTLRNGVFTDGQGKWFSLASQFRSTDGYHPIANKWFNLVNGEIVEVPPNKGWRVNISVDRRELHSDAITFDSSKSGQSASNNLVPIGSTAPLVTFGFRFRVAPWMFGKASVAGPMSLHEPGSEFSGPIACAIQAGKLNFWSKRTKTPDPIEYGVPSTAFENVPIVSVQLPPVGQVFDLVIAMRVDRTGSNSMFEVHRVASNGTLDPIFSTTEPYGYWFKNPALNRAFYPLFELHPWKEWNFPGSGRQPDWNTDESTSDGPVIYIDTKVFSVSDEVTPERMGLHVASYRT